MYGLMVWSLCQQRRGASRSDAASLLSVVARNSNSVKLLLILSNYSTGTTSNKQAAGV